MSSRFWVMNAIATARKLAARHPSARLPCPLCATSLNAENLERHLVKAHAGASPVSKWKGKAFFGLLPCELFVDGEAFVLRRALGFGRRLVRPPFTIEIGALTREQLEAGTSSYADDMNVPVTTVRAGSYLRLGGDGAITVGCRSGTQFRAHWDRAGWREGGPRGRCDVTVDRETFVAIEYALADRGLLAPVARA